MSYSFDLAQTFFVDADAVKQSDAVFITSVDLYFYSKPIQGNTKTGIASPGVTISICPVDENGPMLESAISTFSSRKEYSDILVSTVGATPTSFTFDQPTPLKTNTSYAVLIQFDGSDDDFQLWYNKSGEVKLGSTTLTQTTSGKIDGFLYKITNGKVLTPERDADLKMAVKVARFSSTNETFSLVNDAHEFLTTGEFDGTFRAGEAVYQDRTPGTGTLSCNTTSANVVGSGTSFTSTFQDGDTIVITDGTALNTDVRTIVTRTSATAMTLNAPLSFTNTSASYLKTVTGFIDYTDAITNTIVLYGSTANSTVYLSTGTTLVGVDSQASANISSINLFEAQEVIPSYAVRMPAGTAAELSVSFANSTYGYSAARSTAIQNGTRYFTAPLGSSVIHSRSNEVQNPGSRSDGKSFFGDLTFTTTNEYVSPFVRQENLDLFVNRYFINGDSSDEHTVNGNASSKYISSKVVLSANQTAEDIRVFMTAHRPTNTNIEVYAKIHNSSDTDETFASKNWSKMELVNSDTTYNSTTNIRDMSEFEYKIPTFPLASTEVTSGTFVVTNGSATITGNYSTVSSDIAAGDLVKIADPSFAENYFVASVLSANTTAFVIEEAVSNASLAGDGRVVSKATNPNDAFLNNQNNNVVRYFNVAGAYYDGFEAMSIKVVLLTNDDTKIPYVDDLRAIAVSA